MAVRLDDVLTEIGLADRRAALAAEWELSQAALSEGDLWFLAPQFVREACVELRAPDHIAEAAAHLASRIAASDPLHRLIWHLHFRLYQSGTAGWDDVCGWPTLEAALGNDAGLFYLVLLISNLPTMKHMHRTHRVPETVIRDTLRDLHNWLRVEPPTPGLSPVNVAWLCNHLRGDIYRLGRLQFQFAPCQYDLRAFRHRASRAVLALAGDGARYNRAGQWDDSGGDPAGWTARLRVADEAAVGCPILPAGKALSREVTLRMDEWDSVLTKGDPVLNIHIPGGAPLDHDACGHSLRLALRFFPRHFPERPFVAFCCGSWILNTWLQQALPPTANLVRFQREFYLFPIHLSSEWVVRTVLGEVPADLSRAPRDTQLRRAILDLLAAGEQIPAGGGGGFLLPEDFRWGEQVYLNQPLPFALDS